MKEKSNWMSSHIEEWHKIWENGRIDIKSMTENDNSDASNVYSSLYYLYSSIRNDWNWGLSPDSLAGNGYHGHQFIHIYFFVCLCVCVCVCVH